MERERKSELLLRNAALARIFATTFSVKVTLTLTRKLPRRALDEEVTPVNSQKLSRQRAPVELLRSFILLLPLGLILGQQRPQHRIKSGPLTHNTLPELFASSSRHVQQRYVHTRSEWVIKVVQQTRFLSFAESGSAVVPRSSCSYRREEPQY